MRKFWFFSFLYFALCCRGEAALPEAYRAWIESGVQSGVYRDVAVGWIQDKERSSAFFGDATAESRFEIGAATEIFTGILLAQSASAGKLRLQTSLHERLPQLVVDDHLGALTLLQLITHQAALPAMPANLLPTDPDDPYAGYTEGDLRHFLRDYRFTAGRARGYSPLDGGLVGFALGTEIEGGYGAALLDKVLLPLHLDHTSFSDEALLAGHAHGESAPHWHFGALSGGAGLRSSLADMLDFLQVNLRPENSPLRSALLLARQPHAETQDGRVGLGWNIKETPSSDETWPLLWRASSTAGFTSFLGFRTDRQQALVLMAASDADLSALGMAVLEDRPPPPVPRAHEAAAARSPPVSDQYVGLYKIRNGADIVVRARGDDLLMQLHGEPPSLLHGVGDDVFEVAADGITVSFQREAGTVVNLVLSRAGVSLLAQRLSARAPHIARAAIPIDAKQIDDFVGDYRVGADTLLRITRRADGLTMQLTGRGMQPLLAFAADRFACEDESCELTFKRDASSEIVGADIEFAGGVRNATRASPPEMP